MPISSDFVKLIREKYLKGATQEELLRRLSPRSVQQHPLELAFPPTRNWSRAGRSCCSACRRVRGRNCPW